MGIYAAAPVIEPIESSREWNRYRKGMVASLAPCGMLETTLAEKIILTDWRLRRVARYETEQLRSKQEGATAVIRNQVRQTAASSGRSVIQDFEFDLSEKVAQNTDVDAQDNCNEVEVPDFTDLDEADAQELLCGVHD